MSNYSQNWNRCRRRLFSTAAKKKNLFDKNVVKLYERYLIFIETNHSVGFAVKKHPE